MGSDSDLPVMQGAIDVLTDFGVSFEVRIISAHRTPEAMVDYAEGRGRPRPQVIIAGAGGAAHLPGMTASLTPLPVIGVPVPLKHLDGLDSRALDRADARRDPRRHGRGRKRQERGPARDPHPRTRRRVACVPRWRSTKPTLAATISEKDAAVRKRFRPS